MPDWEDFSEFFDKDEFADKAVFSPAQGDPFEVYGHFDDAFEYRELGGYDQKGQEPKFVCPLAAVSTVTRGTACHIDGVDYLVRGVESEGTGLAVVPLEYA